MLNVVVYVLFDYFPVCLAQISKFSKKNSVIGWVTEKNDLKAY